MADPLASTTDPQGRVVVLLERIWLGKILRDHPEMAAHLDAVLERYIARTTWPTIPAMTECGTTDGISARADGSWRS